MTERQQAIAWFHSRDIPAQIDGKAFYIDCGGYQLEITTAEITYRAELYREEEADND